MLTPTEQMSALEALADYLERRVDVRTFVQTTFTADDVLVLRDIPTDLNRARDEAAFVLGRCLDRRWQETPSLLERLLSELVNAGYGGFTGIRERVMLGVDPNPDPAQALWVAADMPFFSRQASRPVISSLVNADTQPILRVLGPSTPSEGCGKSYTRELLEHIRDGTRIDLRLVIVAIPKGMAASYSAKAVAETLVAPTSRDLASLELDATSNYAGALCRRVLNAAMQTSGRWVYVLDGFGQVDLPVETRELVEALAFEIAGGEYRKRMRLVLVDYPGKLPSVQPARILKDEVPDVSTVCENEIVECLVAHYVDIAGRTNRPSPDRSTLRAVATGLLAAAPSDPATRLETLNSTLRDLRLDDLKRLGLNP